MTIAVSGATATDTWLTDLTTRTLSVDFTSALDNATLVLGTVFTSKSQWPKAPSGITDSRGNKWTLAASKSFNAWLSRGITFSPGGDAAVPPDLTVQLWTAKDTASPATGYSLTAAIAPLFTTDSGAPIGAVTDAAFMQLMRFSGCNTDQPIDLSGNTPGPYNPADYLDGSFGNPGRSITNLEVTGLNLSDSTAIQNPTQANLIGSTLTTLAIVSLCGSVGTLQYPSTTTNFINDGVNVSGTDTILTQRVNGFFDGGPAVNAAGAVMHARCGIVGPWDRANNSIVNLNGTRTNMMVNLILTGDSQPIRRRHSGRAIG